MHKGLIVALVLVVALVGCAAIFNSRTDEQNNGSGQESPTPEATLPVIDQKINKLEENTNRLKEWRKQAEQNKATKPPLPTPRPTEVMPDKYIQVTIYKCQPSRIRPVVTENGVEYYPNYVDPITQEAGVGVFPDREFAQPGNVTYNAMVNYLMVYEPLYAERLHDYLVDGTPYEDWYYKRITRIESYEDGLDTSLYHHDLGATKHLDWKTPKSKGNGIKEGDDPLYGQTHTARYMSDKVSMRWEGFPWYPDEAIEADPHPLVRRYYNVPSRFPEQPNATTYDFEAKERGDKTIQVAGGWIFPNYQGDTSEFCSDREYNTLFKSVAWINPDEYEPALDKTPQKLEWGKPEPAEEVE